MPDININEIVSKPGSERAILSIILNNHDRIVDCESEDLYAEHFSVPGHQRLYSAICYLYSRPDVSSIDSLLVYNTISDAEARAEVDLLGGMAYIDSLIQSRIADNLSLYINHVRTCAIKRMAYNMGEDVKRIVLQNTDDSYSAEQLLEVIQQKTMDLVLQHEAQEEVYHMGDGAEERLRQRAENPLTIPGYSIGWQKYDRYTQGYKGNELTVCVGESKTGKSTWLLNHCDKLSVTDLVPGLYVDTEMTDEEQEDRLLSIISRVPYEEIVNGMFIRDSMYGNGSEKYARLMEALGKIKNAPLYHVYMPSFSIEKVSALVRKYQIQKHIGYAIFDYIKLPTSEIAGLATAQEYQRLGFMTTCLKDLAGICNIPIITAAQANRSHLGSNDPDASNIGGSYRILQMATRMVFIRNKSDNEIANEGYGAGNMKLIIKYQRNGSSDCPPINVIFDRPTLKMIECS
jgi:replicative DNA helicase